MATAQKRVLLELVFMAVALILACNPCVSLGRDASCEEKGRTTPSTPGTSAAFDTLWLCRIKLAGWSSS
jgi:hypothetical protein